MIISGNNNSGNSKFTLPEEDVYQAVCVCIADMGEVFSEKYNKASRKVRICFEIPSLRASTDADAEAYTIWTNDFTASLNEKSALRKFLQSWRNKEFTDAELDGFNMSNLLGAPAQIQIKHREYNGNTYAGIEAVMKLPKGMKVIAEHTPWAYDIDENPVEDAAKLPEYIGNRIKGTETYAKAVEAQRNRKAGNLVPDLTESVGNDDGMDEELPF